MSVGNDAVRESIPSTTDKTARTFKRYDAHALPAADGGGVVFPDGFLGPGYRLDENDYRRCYWEQRRGQAPTAPRAKTGPLPWLIGLALLAGWFLLFGWLLQASAQGLAALAELPRRDLVSGGTIAGFAALYAYGLYRFLTSAQRMAARFPRAERLPYFAHWGRHVWAAVIARPRAWKWTYGAAFLYSYLPALQAFRLRDSLPQGEILVWGLGLIAFLVTLWSLAFTNMARVLGPNPNPEDLKPL